MIIEPHEIPQSWVFTTMGEISTVIGGGTPKTNDPDNYQGGDIPWLTPADLSGYTGKLIGHGSRFITKKGQLESSTRIMPKGTVLYTSRAPIGYVAIASNPICTNQGFKSFILNDGILPDYVYWYLKGTKDLAESMASGTTFLELSGAKAKQIPIPIAPFNEQKRIVAEIEKQFSRLDEAVESLKHVKANLKRYKASVLKAAVDGKLTEEWRKANPDVEHADKLLERILIERRKKWEEAELAKMKTSRILSKADEWRKKYQGVLPISNEEILKLPSLPQGWIYLHMGELIEEPKYGTSKKCGYEKGNVGVLRIPNIIDGIISDKDIKFAEFDEKECDAYKLRDGDILIIRSNGSVSLVGKCAMVTKSDEKYLYAGYLINIRPLRDIVSSKYLVICLSSSFLRNQIESKAKSTSGVNNINAVELQTLIIPLCSLEEQKEIVNSVYARLSVTDHLNSDIDYYLSQADCLRQSILKKAFSGQLVPQDADDEPLVQMAI